MLYEFRAIKRRLLKGVILSARKKKTALCYSHQILHFVISSSTMASAIDSTAPYLFFLLDTDVSNAFELQNALKNIVNNYQLKIFERLEECQKVSRASVGKVIILIASSNHGLQLVSNIHNLQQISCIYIYCSNKEFYPQWIKNYRKVNLS